MRTTRRKFLNNTLLTGIALSSTSITSGKALSSFDHLGSKGISAEKDAFKISIFSKHLQWLNFTDMARTVKYIGFDGVDLTVRPGGHVSPENVAEDLPKAVDAIRKAGIEVFMITTAIKSAREPHAESILKAANSAGIRHYRMGWLDYDDSKSVEENLITIESALRELAQLNKQYTISGEYQNHSGVYFGAPIWDLHAVLKKIDSPWLGSQYDILHATVEGSNAWPIGFKLLRPFIKSLDIKDFQWSKKDGKGVAEVVPLGEGLVDYKKFLSLVKQLKIQVPISVHFEFPLGGAENGATTLTMNKDEVVTAMKKDCLRIRQMLHDAGLV
ncbi:MAG TPA: sugar phosphate isomerase/epimerase family protein [Chryseolinea sp.]|nr:sugar phosphate isomerase/epimerase family protein [Chryseolinea sp.]